MFKGYYKNYITIEYYNKFMKYLFLLLFGISIYSCNTETERIVIVELPQPTVIQTEELSDDIVMSPPLQMKAWKEHFLFFHPGMGKSILFYNNEQRKEVLWGSMGSGPDDFFSPACIYENAKDSIIELFDMNLRKKIVYKCYIEEENTTLTRLEYYSIKSDTISLLGMHRMDNGWHIGFAGVGCNDMFVFMNQKGKELRPTESFGGKPIKEMPNGNFLQLYGWFASYENKFFFAAQPAGYLCCYNISDAGQATKEWEYFLTQPIFDAVTNKWKKENRRGCYDIQVNEEYVFVAFSGETYEEGSKLPQEIIVFSHEGKIIKRLRLNEEFMIGKFSVKEDMIYAYGNGKLISFNWKNAMSL